MTFKTFRATAGCSSISETNSRGSRTATSIAVEAVTVATRGPWSRSAISPKKSPGAERGDVVAADLHVGLAVEDDVELATRLSLAGEDLALGDLDLGRQGRDLPDLLAVAPREQHHVG